MIQTAPLAFRSPDYIIREARIMAWALMLLWGCFFAPIACAALGIPVAIVIHPIVGILLAILLWLTSLIALWSLVRRRFYYQLVLEHNQLRIGQGRRAAAWHPADIDLIIASPIRAPGALKLLQVVHAEALAHPPAAPGRPHPGFVRVQGQGRTRWIYLPPDQIEACASQLAQACPNAVYLDTQQVEHAPPSGIPATAGLILLARQARNLALGLGLFTFLLAICSVSALLSRLYDAPPDRISFTALELFFGIFIGSAAATWAAWRKRTGYLQQIEERQPNPYQQSRPLQTKRPLPRSQ